MMYPEHIGPVHVRVGGKTLLFFAGYDYLNISQSPELKKLYAEHGEEGLGSRAARSTTGDHTLFHQLEERIASFTGQPSALLFPSGYLANLALWSLLPEAGDELILESRLHPSALQGLALGSGRPRYFAPGDLRALKNLLSEGEGKEAPGRYVGMEGIQGHNGSLSPLHDYLACMKPGLHIPVLDESHSFGIFGSRGQGLAEIPLNKGFETLVSSSLAKAAGAFGGFVAGPVRVTDKLRGSDMFRGSSSLPLPLVRVSLAALNLITGEKIHSLHQNALYLKSRCAERGLDIPQDPTPVLILKSEQVDSIKLTAALNDAAIFVPFIRYPGGPEEGFFRFSVSAAHDRSMLDMLITCITEAIIRT